MSGALAPASASTNGHTCDHCGQQVPAGLVDLARAEQFCCSGCELVFMTLQSSGLDDGYYELRSRFGE
ncbi:MAG: heavy metal translocating P-type ATPase metal-binding domain-containing protein, partial [Planctomycetota bacterium]